MGNINSNSPKIGLKDLKNVLKDNNDVNKQNKFGETILHQVIETKDVTEEILEYMLENKCDPNIKIENQGMTPFHLLIKKQQSVENLEKMVPIMLKYKADPNLKYFCGISAFQIESMKTNPSYHVLSNLLESRADPNFKFDGRVALHAFANNNLPLKFFELLISFKADVMSLDNHNTSTLNHYLNNSNFKTDVVGFLLECKSDMNTIDKLERGAFNYTLMLNSKQKKKKNLFN